METKMIDFSYEELQFLSLAMEDKVKELNSKIEIINKFEDSETKSELLNFYTEHREYAALWASQTFSASVEVKKKDIIESN